jgi:uncharacterized protein YjbJ (UPF0337 family)
MDKDRVHGAAKRVKGSVKKAIGKVTGDRKTQAEGATEKVIGNGQSAVGDTKDSVRSAVNKRT